MRPRLELKTPRRRGWPWIAIAASLAVHAVLVLITSIDARMPSVPHRPQQVIVLPPLVESPRAVDMPFRTRRTDVGAPTTPREPRPRKLPEERPVIVIPMPIAPPRVDSGLAVAPPPSAFGRIGPELGDGLLWVRPLPLPPQELAQRLRKTNAELADSVVKATIQAFLDSIAREPGADQAALPEWSTDIAGKKFGVNRKYITVAGLKIPAAVLALIPLHGGTNESKAFDHTDWLLADLRNAAARAQTVDDFKKAIGEMRKRKQEEHDFQKNQRAAPPPDLRSPPPTPAVTQAPPDTTEGRIP